MQKGLRVPDIDWNKKYGPGKFEACADARLGQILYGASLDWDIEDCSPYEDDQTFVGIIESKTRKYYVEEDSNGFFTYLDITEKS